MSAGAFLFLSPVPNVITGLSIYTDNFVSSYATLKPGLQIVLYTNADQALFPLCATKENVLISSVELPKSVPFKLATILISARLSLRCRGFNFFSSTTPLGTLLPAKNKSITIHDLYDVKLQFRSLKNVIFYRFLFFLVRLSRTRVFCVSETTARASKDYFREQQITVLLEASRFPVASLDEAKPKRTRGVFLYVANVQNTKNFPCFLNIARLAYHANEDWTFIWVGIDEKGIVDKLTVNQPLPGNIRAMGQITEEALTTLYRECDALLVTSWDEGFCLPVVEAQASGMPVIVSDIPIMREIAGPNAIFFRPDLPEEGYRQLKRYVSSETSEEAMRSKAIENARRFSWNRSSKKFDEWAG